jgi:carbon-monoxide dehydrogenase medium subunit
VKPSRFQYLDPETRDEALALRAQLLDHESAVLAGGQSLMPMVSMRLAYPSHLIDINRVAELDYVSTDHDEIRIGALARQAAVESSVDVGSRCSLIPKAMRWVGHRSIRNRGTVGGSLAHADPAAELPAVMMALDAVVVAEKVGGRRDIPIGDFLVMPFVTTLESDELLTEVRFPALPATAGSSVREIANRHGDFAIAGIVASVETTDDGVIRKARLAAFGVGPTAARLHGAEDEINGSEPTREAFRRAGEAAKGEVSPTTDVHASADYRRTVTAVLVERALEEAVADAAEGRA